MGSDCVFCTPPLDRIIIQTPIIYALWDGFPVTPGHALIIPRRHVADYLTLTPEEWVASHQLVQDLLHQIRLKDSTVEGVNLGVNVGIVAGQTIFHAHLHVIPRRSGDVAHPQGGIRHLIPGKGSYTV